jgi:hypothetical protein
MPFTSLKVNQRFGGTYRLPLQSRRISQLRYQHAAGRKRVIFKGLHGVMSQKIENPTRIFRLRQSQSYFKPAVYSQPVRLGDKPLKTHN